MILSITIDCGCGQRYTFEVEPVDGRVPSPVACPACGADGTEAANAAIAQSASEPAPAPVGARGPLRVALPERPAQPVRVPDRPSATLLPGQVSRSQAEAEARAKMLWGDPPLQVTAYLMSQGFSRKEAMEMVQEFQRERLMTIRGKGVKFILVGFVLLLFPAVAFARYLLTDRMPHPRYIAFIVILGCGGISFLIKGAFLLASPKKESGDVTAGDDTDSLFD